MRATVEHVRDLEQRLSDDTHLNLRAPALGLMAAHAELTGIPAPANITGGTA